MNWSTFRVLYLHEMLLLGRARRTIVLSVIFPSLVMPLMLLASRYSNQQRQTTLAETTYKFAITGPLASRVRYLIDTTPGVKPAARFHEIQTRDAAKSLEDGSIQFYLRTEDEKSSDGVPTVTVVFRGSNDLSGAGTNRIMSLLERARQKESNFNLLHHGFRGDPEQLFSVDSADLATPVQVSGLTTGNFITAILVVLMFTGGSVTALDSVAGEKERGTLETLLTTAAGRSEIVLAKQTAISTVAVLITLIQALNFLVYFQLKLIPLPANFNLDLTAAKIFSLLVLYVPLAIAVGSVLLLLSAHAKSFREAHLYFFPVYLVGMLLSLASLLPGIALRSAIVVVPIANVSIAAREILVGRPDALMIVITFIAMTLFAAWLLGLSLRVLDNENIVLPALAEPAEFTGGPALFEKRAVRWFIVMWVVQFAAAANPQLASLRRQIVFNELIIMLGASLLMIRLYKLDIRKTLSLKPVRPAVWIATIIAIPCANVVATAVYRLMNLVIPVSQEILRSFSDELVPKDMPQWELFVFVAVIPALCEEVAFRGLLLSALKRRLRPVPLVITIGLVFGVFHMTLFRIFPTAFLGVILTAIALLTGSILPGIALHMGNNAWSVWAGLHDFNPEQLGFWPSTAMIAIFALCMWIIYRNRVK